MKDWANSGETIWDDLGEKLNTGRIQRNAILDDLGEKWKTGRIQGETILDDFGEKINYWTNSEESDFRWFGGKWKTGRIQGETILNDLGENWKIGNQKATFFFLFHSFKCFYWKISFIFPNYSVNETFKMVFICNFWRKLFSKGGGSRKYTPLAD